MGCDDGSNVGGDERAWWWWVAVVVRGWRLPSAKQLHAMTKPSRESVKAGVSPNRRFSARTLESLIT
jgi:hypothetical protein